MTTRRWIDWVNILLGLWMIAAPWALTSATGDGPAAWHSRGVGAALVMLSAFAMHKPSISGDAIGVLVGLWLIASPWLLGFAEVPAAATNGVIVGLLVIGYALWAMRLDVSHQRHRYALPWRRPHQFSFSSIYPSAETRTTNLVHRRQTP